MPHDWNQYEVSKALGGAGWLVIEEHDDGSQTEALVYADAEMPVRVRRIIVGPRGGVYQSVGGTVEGMRDEVRMLEYLIEVADRLEALR